MQHECVSWLVFSGLGWMTIYLNNTYRFIRHGIRVVILYAWYIMTVLDAVITYDRSIGTREAFVQEAANFVSFSDPRGAGTTRALRQADVVSMKEDSPQPRSAGQPNTTHGSRWLDPRVTRISRVMSHDPTRRARF